VRGVKYPDIHVRLIGQGGNAYTVLGRVRLALSRAGVPPAEIKAFTDAATSGDYDHLLRVAMETVDVR